MAGPIASTNCTPSTRMAESPPRKAQTSSRKQATPAEVNELLSGIEHLGWFTDTLYSTEHEPCGQCYTFFLTVADQGQVKTVKAVNGGTDTPPAYWKVIALIDEIIPHFRRCLDPPFPTYQAEGIEHEHCEATC